MQFRSLLHGAALALLGLATESVSPARFSGTMGRTLGNSGQAPPPPQAPLPPPLPGTPNVVVLPVDSASGDSVRTIIARDLDFGDRVRVLALDSVVLRDPSLVAGDSLDYGRFTAMGAAAVVRAVRVPTGLRVTAYDVKTRSVRQSRDFAVPAVPAPAPALDSTRDSLARSLAERAAAMRTALLALARARDSVAATPIPRPSRNPFRRDRRPQRVIAARDSALAELAVRERELVAAARADTVRTDSALAQLRERLARDSAARDALLRAERWALHGVSDEVERWITGVRGVAQTRVAYIQRGRIRVVDSDGANDRAVTREGRGGSALSPSWSPDGKAVVYADFGDAGTQIAIMDLASGEARLLSATRRGLNITPVFTSDGQQVVYATGNDAGGSDLVLADAGAGTGAGARRIGAGRFDSSSPTVNRVSGRIAFVSPRPRTPQIYSMNMDGAGEHLETPFKAGVRSYRTSPDWSPDGRAIAYQQQNGDFQVWMVTLSGHRMRRLTSIGENEDPSWAPDARHVVLTSTREGNKLLWVLDTVTGRMRPLTALSGARLAAWSPRLREP